MQPYIPLITLVLAFVLGIVIAGLLAWPIFRQCEHSFKNTIAAYARLLETRDKEYATLSDRAFALRNLPPSQVDANTEYAERKEAERAAAARRAEQGPVPGRVGPLDRAQLEAIMKARQGQASGSVN